MKKISLALLLVMVNGVMSSDKNNLKEEKAKIQGEIGHLTQFIYCRVNKLYIGIYSKEAIYARKKISDLILRLNKVDNELEKIEKSESK